MAPVTNMRYDVNSSVHIISKQKQQPMTRSQKSPTAATMIGGLRKFFGGRKSWRTQKGSHRSKLHMIMIFYPKCCMQSRRFDQRKQFNTFERTPSVLSTVCDKKQNKLSMFLQKVTSSFFWDWAKRNILNLWTWCYLWSEIWEDEQEEKEDREQR